MLWLALLLVVIAFIWAWRRGTSSAPNRIESPAEVANALQFLLQRGIHGGTVRFQVDTEQSRAIVFTKYIVNHGDVGLRAQCARGGEPEHRLDSLREDLAQRGFPHTLTTSEGDKVIEVQCGRDVGLGVMFVGLVFQRLFETKLSTHCVAYFEGVAIRDASSLTGVDDVPES
jgi:hypothetical protein